MSIHTPDTSMWAEDLPSFEGLFEDHVASIIPSLVRMAIPFFRRSSAPPNGSIDGLIDLSDVDTQDKLDMSKVEKAFLSFQTYIKNARTRLAKQQGDADSLEGTKEPLLEGYLRGFYLACLAREAPGSDVEWSKVAKDCMVGLRVLAPQLSNTTASTLERHIAASIFGEVSNTSPSHFLASLFRQARMLTDELQQHHLQRPGQKGQTRGGSSMDPVVTYGGDALALLGLLDEFVGLVRCFDRLPGKTGPMEKQTKKAAREREEEEKARPGRIILESLLAKCELAMVLASLDMTKIKARALRCHPKPVVDLTGDGDSVAESQTGRGSGGEDDEEDIKPVVTTNEEDAGSDQADTEEELSVSETPIDIHTRWEDEADAALLQCLHQASILARARQCKALRTPVRTSDWLDGDSEQDRLSSHTVDSQETSDTEEESDTESETSAAEETDATGTARPAPLRAIFRLQDRYEELRLAVWLSLPTESRGNMGAYMRGIPTKGQIEPLQAAGMREEDVKERQLGPVGRAWDQLGLLLLKDFDPDALSDLGLDLEKLDKWQDLAYAAGEKKVKKARKTI